ncbi:uncharacterized protein LOC115319343 [Ixodes scapularis]|uniref:uncharacterized protein LOC115319343 n=1 Tax=Ixodes scapularis TaxID=6945 RepID=UPI001C3895EA|nr:uncharacterized protein LOC115319343 [Ixodes scapularis]
MIRQLQVPNAAACATTGNRRADSLPPGLSGLPSGPAVPDPGGDRGEPSRIPDKLGEDPGPRCPEDKRSRLSHFLKRLRGGLLRLLRFPIRGPHKDRQNKPRGSWWDAALSRVNKMASRIQALVLARGVSMDRQTAPVSRYNTLRSDDEWSTTLSPVEVPRSWEGPCGAAL